MNKLVEAISKCVKPHAKPCMNISGGIDSTIVLHHLSEKSQENIYTYTVGFKGQPTEFTPARKVADYYGTRHKEIFIENMLDTYPQILKFFPYPRFNLWPYWTARQAKEDGRLNAYIGEGGDEHFGGYWYKPHASYIEHWAGFLTYVLPTYRTIYDHFGMNLNVPMHPSSLDFKVTLPFYDEQQEKSLLRRAYKGLLPDFVLKRRKLNGRKDYWVMWQQELKPYFPTEQPKSEDDIRYLWNIFVTKEWLRSHPCIVETDRQKMVATH